MRSKLGVTMFLAAAALAAVGASIVMGAGSAATPTCHGKTATVVLPDSIGENYYGDDSREVVVGGTGDDNIITEGGNDIICARGGNDLVRSVQGNDYLNGGPGQDNLAGGPGDDEAYGAGGDETGQVEFRGVPENLQAIITTIAGDDVVNGGNGTDECNSGRGHDQVSNCEIGN